MCRKSFIALVCCTVMSQVPGYADEFIPAWSQGMVQDAPEFKEDQRIVGTHYFYWYDYPDHHFFDDAQREDDALQDHFPEPERVSFNSVEWHKQELLDCIEAGIDFIMPVYWGVVDHYFNPSIAFSVQGLGPLQRALYEIEQEGNTTPKVALFYDTSTLLPGVRREVNAGEPYDLRQAKGKDIFYRTIRDFFFQIHPKHWATIEGRPIVVLYGSGFAAYHDQSTFDYVNEQFQKDFAGLTPYMIRDDSWNATTDAVTSWGAALSGPKIFETVAQIGPGYNDSAVPGRSTPIRDRENGNFYRWSWNQVLQSDVSIVLIETWNEMHEGTTICHSVEYGRDYIELTRYYVERFKSKLGPVGEISLQHPNPLPRPASDRGKEYADALSVSIDFARNEDKGLWLVRGQPDGVVESKSYGGQNCIQTIDSSNTYMYFNIADPFAFDYQGEVQVEYTYWDSGHRAHQLQYDSHDSSATLNGAYKDSEIISSKGQEQWVTRQITLPDARLINRQNGGSDFRFVSHDGWLAIRDVKVTKLNSTQPFEVQQ